MFVPRVWLGSEKGSGGVTLLVISLFVYMVGLAVEAFLGCCYGNYL